MSIFPEKVLRFEPVYQTRVWGGRELQNCFGRELPDENTPFGESWEIAAREEADCQVASGSLAGKTLSELWGDLELRRSIFGTSAPAGERFPLLCKILDARERLSIQVHPPAEIAPEMGGEPKSEVWYIAHAEPGACLYVGLENGVTEESFRAALDQGTAEECVHSIPVHAGEHIYIPSGRLHAIGGGTLIYEIQQNSDTTYRVYDWNRMGMDGKPRQLHVEESIRCIDFGDIEPGMDQAEGALLASCEHFRLERHEISGDGNLSTAVKERFAIGTVVAGSLSAEGQVFKAGDFLMIPAGADAEGIVSGSNGAEILLTTWP